MRVIHVFLGAQLGRFRGWELEPVDPRVQVNK